MLASSDRGGGLASSGGKRDPMAIAMPKASTRVRPAPRFGTTRVRTMTTLPIGPPDLGLELGVDTIVSDDGWLVRELVTPPGLDGPPGILQGGLAAGVCIPIARLADPHGAPLTRIDARLHAPTPLGRRLSARVRPGDGPAHYRVEIRDGDRLLVSAEVELAGHDLDLRSYDLQELATARLPEPERPPVFPTCWVCGPQPRHPLGQHLYPRHVAPGAVSIPWIADERLGDPRSTIDPLVVAAVLDCPTVWASYEHVRALGHTGALLAGYELRILRDAPVMEQLRTVARMDEAQGRKIRARGALLDEDGVVYALSSALHVSVPEIPSLPVG